MSGLLDRLKEKIEREVEGRMGPVIIELQKVHGELIKLNDNITKLNEELRKLIKVIKDAK